MERSLDFARDDKKTDALMLANDVIFLLNAVIRRYVMADYEVALSLRPSAGLAQRIVGFCISPPVQVEDPTFIDKSIEKVSEAWVWMEGAIVHHTTKDGTYGSFLTPPGVGTEGEKGSSSLARMKARATGVFEFALNPTGEGTVSLKLIEEVSPAQSKVAAGLESQPEV